jgi:DmsE family decaheme c-type cytochrome
MRYVAWFRSRGLVGLLTGLSIIAVVLISSSLVRGQEDPQKSTPPAEGEYVGDETCATCHAEISEAFPKTVHGGKAYAERTSLGCEHCHGPGQAHVDSNGDVTLIRSFKRMKASEASDLCLQCHEKGLQTHWKGSVHDQRELGCVSCHSVHSFKSEHAQLKTAHAEEQCGTCHQNIKAQIMKTSHHPIREGLMKCSDCHNPHGTLTPKMLTANSVNEQCYTCHAEKRGPFLWEHPPVKENCLNCHNPHGSNHPKLMVQKRPFICQSCHLDTRHPGTLYDGTTGSLTSNRDFSRSCSNCHLTIHGSNHPSGWTFTR